MMEKASDSIDQAQEIQNRGVAVGLGAQNGNIAVDTQHRHQKLFEIGPFVLAEDLGDVKRRTGQLVIAENAHESGIEVGRRGLTVKTVNAFWQFEQRSSRCRSRRFNPLIGPDWYRRTAPGRWRCPEAVLCLFLRRIRSSGKAACGPIACRAPWPIPPCLDSVPFGEKKLSKIHAQGVRNEG